MDKIKILRIISVILFIPAVISLILWRVGLLDLKIFVIFNWTIFLGEVAIFLFISKNSITTSQSNVIIPKGVCEEKVIEAETNIFPQFLVPTNTYRDCVFRVSLQIKEFKKYPLFYIVRKCTKDMCIQELNKDIKLVPGMVHIFDVPVDCNEKLNFKFNEDVFIQKLLVEELYAT